MVSVVPNLTYLPHTTSTGGGGVGEGRRGGGEWDCGKREKKNIGHFVSIPGNIETDNINREAIGVCVYDYVYIYSYFHDICLSVLSVLYVSLVRYHVNA